MTYINTLTYVEGGNILPQTLGDDGVPDNGDDSTGRSHHCHSLRSHLQVTHCCCRVSIYKIPSLPQQLFFMRVDLYLGNML